MATFELETSFNALPDSTILPNYAGHPVVQAKLLDFSTFKPLDSRQVYEALNTFFTDLDMIVIAHSDTLQPVPMSQMTLEALHQAVMSKLRSEAQALMGDEHLNVYNDLKAMVEANDESSANAMIELQQLCFRSVLEAISCSSVKKGALFSNPFTQTPILLLGGRGLYLSDKAKVAAAIAREKKAKKSSEKAPASKKAKKNSATTINPQGKPRRTISDDEDERNQQSEGSIDDVSCHGGDGDSPYDSEWAHSSDASAPATPVLAKQPQPEEPIQLTLTPSAQASDDTPRLPLNIQLAANPMVPLFSIPPPTPLGGTMGSVPVAAPTLKQSSRRKSKKGSKDKKKKAKKTKRSKSPSRSRSSSSSSVASVVLPPARPSADQVFCVYSSHLV